MGKKLLKVPLLVANSLILFPITYTPGWFGNKLRYFYYKVRCKHLGKKVRIDVGAIIENPQWVFVGDNTWIDKHCILIAGQVKKEGMRGKVGKNPDYLFKEGELRIGANVHIAPFCIIQAHAGVFIEDNSGFSSGVKVYSFSNFPVDPNNPSEEIYFTPMRKKSAYFFAPIVIKDNVGIALNSIVLPGVTIGEKSFVAPCSVVMTSFKPNSYIAGNPARRIRERFVTK